VPRTTKPLTVKQIENAKPKEKQYKLFDGGGLFLLVLPNGSKVWRYKYRLYGKEFIYSIGAYSKVSLAKARNKHKELMGLVVDGINPNELKKQHKTKENETKALSEFEIKTQLHLVVDEWLEMHSKKVKAYTATKTKAMLYNDLLSYFTEKTSRGYIKASIPIGHLKHHQITDILKQKAKETEYSAKRLKQFLNRIWKFAVTSGYCEVNIIDKISDEVLPAPKTKHFSKITDEIMLKKLLHSIDTYTGSKVVKASLEFVTYTMLRASTLVSLKWEYVDFENKTITVPREEMKVKDDNLNDFTLPLVDKAIQILEELKPLSGWSEYIFSIDGKPINKESGNRALQHMGFKGQHTLHSFRGTFRSLVETYQDKHNAPYEVKEAVLDHQVSNKVVRAYTHKSNYVEQMRSLLEWYEEYLREVKYG
jgi:integrase